MYFVTVSFELLIYLLDFFENWVKICFSKECLHLLLLVAYSHWQKHFNFLFPGFSDHMTNMNINSCEGQHGVSYKFSQDTIFLLTSYILLWLPTLYRGLLLAYLPWAALGFFHGRLSYQHWSSVPLGSGRTSSDESQFWSLLPSRIPALISPGVLRISYHLILKGLKYIFFWYLIPYNLSNYQDMFYDWKQKILHTSCFL